eukprot:3067503-Rhodomonas_salina.1
MADNHLLAYKATTSTSAIPKTICTVNTAIMIAQKHIKQMPYEVITPAAAMVLKTVASKSVLKVCSKLARMEDAEDDTVTAEALTA